MIMDLVTIYVKNLEESMEFYTDVLGLTEKKRISPQPFLHLVFLQDEAGNIVELIKNDYDNTTNENETGRVTLGFKVENLKEISSLLESKNVKIEPGPMPGYIFIYDPNGVKIGLKENIAI